MLSEYIDDKIVELLDTPKTSWEIAQALGVKRDRISTRVSSLIRFGLLRRVKTLGSAPKYIRK